MILDSRLRQSAAAVLFFCLPRLTVDELVLPVAKAVSVQVQLYSFLQEATVVSNAAKAKTGNSFFISSSFSAVNIEYEVKRG